MRKALDYLVYLLAVGAMALFRHIPRPVFFFCAPGVARILSLIPSLGGISRMNLRAAFPEKTEKECREIARKSLANLFLSLCEFLWCQGKREIVESLIDMTDEVRMLTEKSRHSGVPGTIFITPHLGNWEFAGIALAQTLRCPIGTVARTPRNRYLGELISSGRMVEGVTIIHSKGAVRSIVKHLAAGHAIGILIDQNTRLRDGGEFVNFFGLPVPVSMTPAHLARKENRFIGVGSLVRRGSRFHPMLVVPPKPASEYGSDQELTQALMDISCDMIRQYPDQYLWVYRRFQYIPPDTPEELRRRYPPYAVVPGGKFFSNREKYKERQAAHK